MRRPVLCAQVAALGHRLGGDRLGVGFAAGDPASHDKGSRYCERKWGPKQSRRTVIVKGAWSPESEICKDDFEIRSISLSTADDVIGTRADMH